MLLLAETMSPFVASLVVAVSVGAACAVLSVLVVAKRWAFIGEGIAHAGFGGAGTAWLAAMLFPAVPWLTDDGVVYAISIAFCMAVALGIAAFTRRRRAAVDTVIGVFLVTSLAWGFLAYGLYARQTGHMPPQFADYLGFTPLRGLSERFVALAVVVSAAVLGAAWALWKELLFYGTDERQAELSGVRVGLVHYGLILMLAATIMVGMRLMGTVLVVALLVLPGATALLLGRRTRSVWAMSMAVGVGGATAGPLINRQFPFVPEGPAIVLVLFVVFCLALAANRLLRR
ncbi:MAG: metal ABC transporter permease [Tepidisphaerales bacterium]